jgi:hypothetical protein
MAKQRVADRLQSIATGCFWPIFACRHPQLCGLGWRPLTLRTVWSDDVKSSPGYDYRPLMFEASFDTNLLGDPR